MHELKEHAWFQGFNWHALKTRTMKPIFVPRCKQNNFDYENVNRPFRDKELFPVDQANFKDYYFNEEENVRSLEAESTSCTTNLSVSPKRSKAFGYQSRASSCANQHTREAWKNSMRH